MSITNRWLSLLLALFLLPALVSAASGSGSRTMDYAWLLFLKVNKPPLVDAGGPQQITSNSAQLTATVTDDPGDTLTYHWVQDSGPGVANFNDEFSKETLVTFTASGSYTLIFTADDGGFESSDTVIITVTNTPPNVNAGGDKQITHPTNSVSLSGSVSDAENNMEGVAWSKVSGPGGVAFSNPSSAVTGVTFSSGAVGTYVLRLSASDWEHTSSDTVTVNYLSQPAPKIDVVVSIGDSITVGVGDELSCQANSPGTPQDDLSKTCDGYTVPLGNFLSGKSGFASTVYMRERGVSGSASADLLHSNRLQNIINQHYAADLYLIMYGTNDANWSPPVTKAKFKSNMQTILLTIKGTKNNDGVYMQPVLAKAAYAKSPYTHLNSMIQQYNLAVVELTNTYNLKGPANMYDFFKNNQNLLNNTNLFTGAPDGLHPTHTGYYWMSQIWASKLIQ